MDKRRTCSGERNGSGFDGWLDTWTKEGLASLRHGEKKDLHDLAQLATFACSLLSLSSLPESSTLSRSDHPGGVGWSRNTRFTLPVKF